MFENVENLAKNIKEEVEEFFDEHSFFGSESRETVFKEIEVSELAADIKTSENSAVLPPGEYYVGDPSYTAGKDDKAWQEWVNIADRTSNSFTDGISGAAYNDYPVVAVNTLYGDGLYEGSDGNSYSVDSGSIGVVPVELVKKMQIHSQDIAGIVFKKKFDEAFTLTVDEKGLIKIGALEIPTGD
jgi:hypothetical protein